MNEQTLQAVSEELAEVLPGARFGKVFTLSRRRFVIDMRLRDGRFLFISVETRSPRVHLVERRLRDLEKASLPDQPFVQALRKHVANASLQSVEKPFADRILFLRLTAMDEIEGKRRYTFVVQLTGRSSNLFLLDQDKVILASLGGGSLPGQKEGDRYSPPSTGPMQALDREAFEPAAGESISEALDRHYSALEEKERRDSAFRSRETLLKRELKKKRRLKKALLQDLEDHGDGDQWKMLGELLLANASTAVRVEEGFRVTDYYQEGTPEIVIDADPRHSAAEAADKYFRKYSKARNARTAIARRLESVEKEIASVSEKLEHLRASYRAGAPIEAPQGKEPRPKKSGKKRRSETAGVRKFTSRDGFEILVGRRSKDNDTLTFRIAGSLDTWMHAADYPGSHVVIRNPARKEVPHSTLIEAARIAAFYSKAKGEAKAAVHYTLRKFVHKPKGAKPGLVSLADFKTIIVEPGIPEGMGT